MCAFRQRKSVKSVEYFGGIASVKENVWYMPMIVKSDY